MRSLAVVLALVVLPWGGPVTAEEEDYAVRVKAGEKPGPVADKASVFVVRPAQTGMVIRMWAFAEDIALGLTKGDTYAHAYLEPGMYTFWSRAENVSAVVHTVEAGKTYYLKQAVRIGGLKARVHVEFLTDEEGAYVLGRCNYYSTLTDAGLARAAEIAAEKREIAKEKADDR
jgi:hypothetical protein